MALSCPASPRLVGGIHLYWRYSHEQEGLSDVWRGVSPGFSLEASVQGRLEADSRCLANHCAAA
jgi:hypothetical protein